MIDDLKEDFRRYEALDKVTLLGLCLLALRSAGFRASVLYRLGYWFRKNRAASAAAMSERIMHHVAHCWISTRAEIGPGFLIAHVGGVVIGQGTRIGRNCDVRQNVTFGGNYQKKNVDGRTQPWVGDDVSVGVGAVIIGPVRIGSGSVIGANSVVNRDVPESVVVFGVPAEIVGKKWDEDSGRGLG